jgi:molecular chaperone GrpE (heat shock protein)
MRCYNAAMIKPEPTIEELIARLAKLDDERLKLVNESARLRRQLLAAVEAARKAAGEQPKSP